MSGPGTDAAILELSGFFVWFEGAFDGHSVDKYGLEASGVYVAVDGVTAQNFVSFHSAGVALFICSHCRVDGVVTVNAGYGLNVDNRSVDDVIRHVRGPSTISGYNVMMSDVNGLVDFESPGGILSGVTAVGGSANTEIGMETAGDNLVVNVTVANAYWGVWLGTGTTLGNALLTANFETNLNLAGAEADVFDIDASFAVAYGIELQSSTLTVHGSLNVHQSPDVGGKPCFVSADSVGLRDTTCANSGASDAVFASSGGQPNFVGAVSDSANTQSTLAPLAASAITDWTLFASEFHLWGSPSTTNDHFVAFGACASAASDCVIVDYSLQKGNVDLLGVNAIPTGDDVRTHDWVGPANDSADCDLVASGSVFVSTDTCRTTYLENAYEISGDGVGNDNLLCETGERCVFTPNRGSYQGHGRLVATSTAFQAGAIHDVVLMQYESNGY